MTRSAGPGPGRARRLVGLSALAVVAGLVVPVTPWPSVAPSWATMDVGDTVFAIAVQPDGKVLLGGAFPGVNGVASAGVARILPDGSVDTAFSAALGSGLTGLGGSIVQRPIVRALAVQPDGRILVAGEFAALDGTTSVSVARLAPDGSRDATFTSPFALPTGYDRLPSLSAAAVMADGSAVVAGYTLPGKVVRLHPDGSLDSAFTAKLGTGVTGGSAMVTSLAVQPDGKLLIGGLFTAVNGVRSVGIARLNADGSPDVGFSANTGSGLRDLSTVRVVLQPDGRILVGGGFSVMNAVACPKLARFNADGTLDAAFCAALGGGFWGGIEALGLGPDGRIVASGSFLEVGNTASRRLARLSVDGALDVAFARAARGPSLVNDLEVLSDGSILLGGAFTAVGSVPTQGLAKVRPDGSVDPAFGPVSGSADLSVAVSGGALVVTVGPDPGLDRHWFVRIRKRTASGTWRYARSARTEGTGSQTLTYDGTRGVYKVIVRPQFGRSGAVAGPVRLAR